MYDRHRVAAAIFAVFMKVVRGNLGPPHRYDEREVGYGARFEALAKSDLSMRPHAPVWLPAEPYTPVEIDSIMVSTVVGSSVDESVFSSDRLFEEDSVGNDDGAEHALLDKSLGDKDSSNLSPARKGAPPFLFYENLSICKRGNIHTFVTAGQKLVTLRLLVPSG